MPYRMTPSVRYKAMKFIIIIIIIISASYNTIVLHNSCKL